MGPYIILLFILHFSFVFYCLCCQAATTATASSSCAQQQQQQQQQQDVHNGARIRFRLQLGTAAVGPEGGPRRGAWEGAARRGPGEG